jgi:broad specificity phosphatase PhoE
MNEFSLHLTDIPYPPDGECGADVWKRAIKVMDEIIDLDLNEVAVVTHGGVIRALISGFLGLSQARRFYIGAPPENCSMSIIKYNRNDNNFYVHSINDYAHLEEMRE